MYKSLDTVLNVNEREINRCGKKYIINEKSSDTIDEMIDDMYNECLKKISASKKKITIFSYLQILTNIVIIVFGSVTSVMTLLNKGNTMYNVIFGFSISTIQTILSMFTIEKRISLYKTNSKELKKLSWKLRELKLSDDDIKLKLKRLDEIYLQVDELDVNVNDYTPKQ